MGLDEPITSAQVESGGGLTCDPGYIFQRADGQDGRPDDNACGALGGCVNKAELDGQVCGKACDRDCANLFDMADSVATADITMYGETHLDRDFGAILDGVGDYLTFEDTGVRHFAPQRRNHDSLGPLRRRIHRVRLVHDRVLVHAQHRMRQSGQLAVLVL